MNSHEITKAPYNTDAILLTDINMIAHYCICLIKEKHELTALSV